MRRVVDGERLAARKPWLAGSILLLVGAFVLLGMGHEVAAFTALIAAFLAVAVAKRSG